MTEMALMGLRSPLTKLHGTRRAPNLAQGERFHDRPGCRRSPAMADDKGSVVELCLEPLAAV